MNAPVTSKWKKITFSPGDTRADIDSKLLDKLVDLNFLHHSVYVIRLTGIFAIQYINEVSPVIYIGEGHFRGRLSRHRIWLRKLGKLFAEMPLEVKFCHPTDPSGSPRNKELEAHLLQLFKKKFGELPIQNKQQHKLRAGFSFATSNTGHILGPGAGKKYKWAIRALIKDPLKANQRGEA